MKLETVDRPSALPYLTMWAESIQGSSEGERQRKRYIERERERKRKKERREMKRERERERERYIYIDIYICCRVIIWAKFGHLKGYYLGQVLFLKYCLQK